VAKAKKSTRKAKVEVRDMKAKKDPKGGTLNYAAKWEAPQVSSTPGTITVDVSSLNFKK